ncbi:MAG: hypothetical protein EHM49_00895 [Deltaproteobacteria bacterium]|nr:MAG: hypothetical protein EHM49_00895 [Deltaproteobacteria bacterium]
MAVTWNPSDKAANITLSGGDLTAELTSASDGAVRATLGVSSGKWYWEVKVVATGSVCDQTTGIGTSSAILTAIVGSSIESYGFYSFSGNINHGSGSVAYCASNWIDVGDIVGIALDLDNGKIWFAVNNVWCDSGDPAAGTGEAFSGISGTYYPMHAANSIVGSKWTASFNSEDQTYSPPSGFLPLDNPESGTNLLDGKITIATSATNLLDGKVVVDGLATTLLDGKVIVDGLDTDLLDGKVVVLDSTTNLFDGKVVIATDVSSLLDGEVTVESDGVNLLDGKVVVATSATNILDGKLYIPPHNIGEFDLPIFEVEAQTGASGECSLPIFEVDAEASHWVTAVGSNSLPRLSAIGYTGAVYQGVLPSLSCEGEAVVGTVASGEIELPLFEVSAEALISIISSLEENLPSLRVNASSSGGVFVKGAAMLPPLHLVAEGLVGRLVSVEITLPSLEVTGELAHVPVGSGEMELPGLEMLAVANLLYSPEQGCHILRHSR